ncbi:unnamed protein product [Prunus armeniaca]|uniref:Uncharacterized protein n=1 Tax=Prunus armeniaca TaxID=36596 RepID=A0A6J5U6R9_PRUAR|nr:unnamed protein product [Prunus armeniaca]CAB4302052.1 unnamed protein product [Prunus armeniaca]
MLTSNWSFGYFTLQIKQDITACIIIAINGDVGANKEGGLCVCICVFGSQKHMQNPEYPPPFEVFDACYEHLLGEDGETG